MIAADKDFIHEAMRVRQALGGGTRQTGIVAAACEVALDRMIDRLADDHKTAQILARGLADLPGILIDPETVKTNIIFFDIDLPGISQVQFVQLLKEKNILMFPGIRAVTHYGIEESDIAESVERIRCTLNELRLSKSSLSRV
jgi:threonine aldolase